MAGQNDVREIVFAEIIDDRLDGLGEACTLRRSASATDTSISFFERTGTTFEQCVIESRLDGAASDLRDPRKLDRTIGAIAFDWAFADLSHFSRRFKKRYGCTPTAWRFSR
jgi:AraC-like DNA-binding protein